ncbi:hypothetical protein niasHT_012713 [Heterodera trifolii]|uniref:Uncharacterized protein n=1 Tax=Heterodera trifolii TaxID=157864 RepID=A0ABD2LCP9_9BILA
MVQLVLNLFLWQPLRVAYAMYCFMTLPIRFVNGLLFLLLQSQHYQNLPLVLLRFASLVQLTLNVRTKDLGPFEIRLQNRGPRAIIVSEQNSGKEMRLPDELVPTYVRGFHAITTRYGMGWVSGGNDSTVATSRQKFETGWRTHKEVALPSLWSRSFAKINRKWTIGYYKDDPLLLNYTPKNKAFWRNWMGNILMNLRMQMLNEQQIVAGPSRQIEPPPAPVYLIAQELANVLIEAKIDFDNSFPHFILLPNCLLSSGLGLGDIFTPGHDKGEETLG